MTGRDLARMPAGSGGRASAPRVGQQAAGIGPAPSGGGGGALGARVGHRPRSPAGLLEADSGALLTGRALDEQAGALARTSGGRLALAGPALLRLQRLHGNRHVQRVVSQARQASPAPRTAASVIQPKLTLGRPGDRYEREADRMVAQAGLTPNPARSASRREDEDGTGAGRTDRAEGGVVDPGVQRAVAQARGSGQPFPDRVRRRLEGLFELDFGAVRVHVDADADRLSRRVGALAFTMGTDIFFRAGEYDPGSSGGQALIAHELTHVQQQTGASALPSAAGTIQRLISASKFRKKTSLSARKGKSHKTFEDIAAGLGRYEATEDIAELQQVYLDAQNWLNSPEAATSSRREHVERLIQPDLATEPTRAPARKLISASALSKKHKKRAAELIDHPDEIDQTAFGVCGLVSILRPVLTYDPERFADLAIRALTDPNLDQKKWKGVFAKQADKKQKAKGAEFEYLVSQWLVRHAAPTEVSQKIAERKPSGSVAERVKKKRYSDVFQAQKDFSDAFNIAGWEEKKGHFAVTTGGLNYLVGSVIGAPQSYKIKVRDFAEDYQLAKAKAGTKGQIIASVTDTHFYQPSGNTIDTSPKVPGTKFVHWVMIEDVQQAGHYFDITLWTWALFFDVRVHENVAEDYFYSFVAVSFD